MTMVQTRTLTAVAALSFTQVLGLTLKADSTDSIKSTASTIANGAVSYYHGNETGEVPGVVDAPYYWWQGGMLFDTLIKYWHLTGDSQYNDIVTHGIQFQQGPDSDFMPPNQTKSEGNDDQGVWALVAMSAAESELPEVQKGTSWVALADGVFSDQVRRWDPATCGGGLRWQIFPFNTGYDYKDSLSNGELFQLASRLARFTGNTTYSDWASKIFTWSTNIGFVDAQWNVFEGAEVPTNCTSINRIQFSSNAASYVAGAANMYNMSSGDATWKTALDGLLNRTLDVFFPSGILTEISCESVGSCTTDMMAFTGILAGSLVNTIKAAPYTSEIILPLLTSSAQAAANACSDQSCSGNWNDTPSNVTSSLGDQMSALNVVQALLVDDAAAPGTSSSADSLSSGNSTSADSGSTTKPTQTPSGTAPASSTNAAVVLGGEGARVGLLTAVLGFLASSML